MQMQKNISLLPYNSFHLDANASEFMIVKTVLRTAKYTGSQPGINPALILGGGSNIFLTKNVEGLVIKIEIKGNRRIERRASHIYVKAGAGENWHEFVQYTMKRNWGGLENLSLIPGKCRVRLPFRISAPTELSLKMFFMNSRPMTAKKKKYILSA